MAVHLNLRLIGGTVGTAIWTRFPRSFSCSWCLSFLHSQRHCRKCVPGTSICTVLLCSECVLWTFPAGSSRCIELYALISWRSWQSFVYATFFVSHYEKSSSPFAETSFVILSVFAIEYASFTLSLLELVSNCALRIVAVTDERTNDTCLAMTSSGKF